MLNYEEALQIAERHIKERVRVSDFLSRYEFGELGLRSENERFWTFVRGSDQLFDEGYVPGAVYACVDKADGHLWSGDEVEQFYLQKAATRQSQLGTVAA
ncbi:MAG: hypothetical protein ACREEM_47210 [Blastocatellia bacterium]